MSRGREIEMAMMNRTTASLQGDQESQARACTGAGRDQANSECAFSDWAIHGGHRSEVRHRIRRSLTTY